jgi:transcriptional regulator with XRE-family HTH domain
MLDCGPEEDYEMAEPDTDGSSEPTDKAEVEADTFAVRLERLISVKKHDDGRPYTKPEIAEEMGQQGRKVSKSHLYGLLNGTSKPSLEVAQDFAEYFQVELEYFSNNKRGREIQAQYELLARLSDRGVRDLAFRASTLPPDKLSSVLDYIDFQAARQNRDDRTSG